MKKTAIFSIVLLLGLMPASCFAEVDFILNINPGNWLISTDADDFSVTTGWLKEDVEGYSSWMPTMAMGIGFDTTSAYIDIVGGVGYQWNNLFTTTMYMADVAYRFKLNQTVTLGPHISVVFFSDPDWEGIANVTLDDTTGWMPGLAITAGSKKVSFSASIDYLDADFDVKTSGGWAANKNSLDISGFLLQVGVLFRF